VEDALSYAVICSQTPDDSPSSQTKYQVTILFSGLVVLSKIVPSKIFSNICPNPKLLSTYTYFIKYIMRMHTKGGGGGTSCTHSKDFEKLNHKNVINMKIEDPSGFSHSLNYPAQKNLKMTVHL
jgi:hypothetical protein